MSDEIKTPEEIKKAELKALQEKNIADAKAAQEKVAARIRDLKNYEGKTFIENGTDGRTTFKVIRYEGIGKLANGDMAHLFRVERFNPGAIYTPPATQFLAEHTEIEVKLETQKEII